MLNKDEKFFEEEDIFSDDEYKLIFTSVKRGYEGEVLEAAKLAGHSGAVVMQAKAVDKMRKRIFKMFVSMANLQESAN